MKVHVDPERCQGHTLCAMIAPDTFQLSDLDGSSSARFDLVPPDQENLVREAARSCPEQAIIVDEAQDGTSTKDLGHEASSPR